MRNNPWKINLSKRILMFVVLLLCIMAIPQQAMAASATIRFDTESTEVAINEQVVVSLVIDTDSVLGDFEGTITYNSQVMRYVEGPSCIAGSDGMLRIEDCDTSGSQNTRSYVMTFEAISTGDCEFSFSYAPMAFEYQTNEAMSVSASSSVVHVMPPATASENATLSSLKIHPSSLTPSFDSSITEYSAIVDASVSSLILSAIPEDTNATVSVEGNENLQLGTNTVVITVTAESGARKAYTISVEKAEQVTMETPNPEASQAELADNTVNVTMKEGTTLLIGQYKYTVVDTTEGITIPEGYQKTTIRIDGCKVPVYQLEKKVEDDYLLLVLENQFNQISLYRYDRLEKTIQRYSGERVIVKDNAQDTEYELSKQKKKYETKIAEKNIILVVMIGIGIVLLIGIITMYLKVRDNREDDF